MNSEKNVVVFGGSGFLGSHVADALSNSGHNVTIFDIKPSQYKNDNQKLFVGDILDRNAVRKAVKGADYVYHYAAVADINEAKQDPITTVRTNILSTVFILDACREFRVERFVYGSTIYVYSSQGSFYRSSKQAAELFIENYHEAYGLEYTILRYGSLYGTRANHFNFINNIINQAILNKKIIREGDGSELREYIHVLDAARASVEILLPEYVNSNIMITGDKTMRVKDLLLMVKEMFENNIEIEYKSSEEIEHHYNITPYAFKPRVATKYSLKDYHDLGQGILELIYENFKLLENKNNISR